MFFPRTFEISYIIPKYYFKINMGIVFMYFVYIYVF